MARQSRDSKDPMPTSKNSARQGGGNEVYPAGSEKHGQSKAEKISADSRFGSGVGPTQPTRQKGDGNTSVTGETHDSAKAEKISADSRF